MRVIAGTAKGRKLKGPATFGTRPMTDRLKVSLFDTLAPYGIEGARVLDLYAGSGSLGIEMLSRGADWADFVEQNAAVCRIIQENLATTRLSDRAKVYKMPVARFLAMRSGQAETSNPESDTNSHSHNASLATTHEYDIILLDPPYADPSIKSTLEGIAKSPLVAPDGLVVIGHATQVKLADDYGGGRLRRIRHRAMGGSAFSIYEVDRQQTTDD
jgi:16S rRNA (guanine966-N2)-methyltransferase